jgi:hypothetical protein
MGKEERLVRLCIDDYNVYRAQTKYFHDNVDTQPWLARPATASPARMKLFGDMVSWCRERNLEPRLWLFSLFKARAWRFPPKAAPGVLMSGNLIPKYRALKGLGVFKKRVFVSTSMEHKTDPNVDLIYAVETIKRRYAASGQHERCMEEAMVRTMGFHPLSPICAGCPVSGDCAIRLSGLVSFDIIGARAEAKKLGES